MAYEPKEWQCGEYISAEGLNNIEEGIQEALAKECDCGYSCVIERTILFEGSLTTEDMEGFAVATFISSEAVDSESITVTIDGIEYELPKVAGISAYGEFNGAPVFTTYPCLVVFGGEGSMFATENPGTYSVKIETSSEVIRTTECFGKAVNSVIDKLEHLLDGEADGSLRGNTAASEGNGYALGTSSVALGVGAEASGIESFAEGHFVIASGNNSHAEGYSSTASGSLSHAEGGSTVASGQESHAEGVETTASGIRSHAEGSNTTASGSESHAEGHYTIANHYCQHTSGAYNVPDPSTAPATSAGNYIEIVGNGSPNGNSNARTLDWSGNETIAGTLTQSSDKRLKEHIEYLGDDAIEFVKALKPAHYIKDNAHHTGFYAQDVEEIDKWDCMTGEMNGYMTLGYIELIAPLVAYCHSLEERIAVLEGK